jgi:hypothetical protein
MNRNAQNIAINRLHATDSFPPISTIHRPESRASTESVSSAEERLQWRSHPNVATPHPDPTGQNPFDDPNLALSSPLSREGEKLGNGAHEQTQTEAVEEAPCNNSTADTSSSEKTEEPQPLAAVTSHGSTRRSARRTLKGDVPEKRKQLSFKERIRHFTWTWFCLTMATGGIANVLYSVPFRFRGLYALGCIFFILNIVFFLFNCIMISCRFYFYPRTFKASFLHPTESLFIPAAMVSFGIILINVSQYGVHHAGVGNWLEKIMIVLFWMDCGLAVCFSVGIYLLM